MLLTITVCCLLAAFYCFKQGFIAGQHYVQKRSYLPGHHSVAAMLRRERNKWYFCGCGWIGFIVFAFCCAYL